MFPETGEGTAERRPARPATGFGEGSPTRSLQPHRAAPPRAPVLPPALQEIEAEYAARLRLRRSAERRSMLRGLILLALLVLFASLLRAGMDRAFPAGWWQRW